MEIFEEIKACRICDSENIVTVMDLGQQPPANSLRSELSEKLLSVPLQLMHCGECSTVQLSATVDPEFLFSHYVWVTGTSKAVHEYSKYFSTNVLERSKVNRPFVVEVASNDGTFLKDFAQKGCKVLGIDPAKNIAKIATDNGIPTMAEFFNLATAKQVIEQYGKADIVFARNVIPHVKQIHSIIEGFGALLKEEGLGVIEFHYSQIILDELHYDSVYHEHLFYFSLKSLTHLLQQYGFNVFDVTKSPISGGSLVIYFSKDKKPASDALQQLMQSEQLNRTNELETWNTFSKSCSDHAKKLRETVKEYKAKGPVLGYGASARSSTMLNYAGLNSEYLDCIIDKNPMKHGKFTPGTNIPIISFEDGKKLFDGKSTMLLLAWNFEKEIIEELRANGFTGDIIVPLPSDIKIK